jgi:hypothetical protein
MRLGPMLAPLVVAAVGACVPPDNAIALGSVEVTLRVSAVTREGVPANIVYDGWSLRFERALLSFKTITIGQVDNPNACSYRGRAEQKNAVFDLRQGIVQSFNGMLPDDCGDVGAVFGPPDGYTVPVAGASGDDLLELASDAPAHARIEVVATRGDETYRVVLRFDTARTSSKLAGCRSDTRGVHIAPNERTKVALALAGDQFFRDALSTNGGIRFAPFVDADRDDDHVITMDELDLLPLSAARIYSDGYVVAGGSSFGDFVRAQFRYAWLFGTASGTCSGKDPGAD